MDESLLNSNVNAQRGPIAVAPMSSNSDQVREWSTKLGAISDCLKDEESCWWTLWCCWIVNARTIHMFSLGDSFAESCLFWVVLVILVICTLVLPPIGITIAIAAFFYLAWRRAKFRSAMRQKLSIPGTFNDDLLMHSFCTCCAICQESQEAKIAQFPSIDFCFGEPLVVREQAHENAVAASSSQSCQESFSKNFNSLSKTSKFIVLLWTLVALVTVIADLVLNTSANILVLVLIFIQPVLILYFVYWRYRRQSAYLDYVVKTFAYGFWFATFQSIVLESILQFILAVFVLILVPSSQTMTTGDATEEEQKEMMKNNIAIVIFSLIFTAYVIAGGVEETMKHFVVRCCQFPTTLKDPNTVLVYLMSAALGFATAENIEYVFSQDSSPVPGVTLLAGEVLLLLLRVLTPVHVICSVLQTCTYSKVLMGQRTLNLFQVLFPAVMLHGSFDFILMAMAAFAFMYDLPSMTFEIISFVIAIVISTGGLILSYYWFKKVDNDYRNGSFQLMPGEEIISQNESNL